MSVKAVYSYNCDICRISIPKDSNAGIVQSLVDGNYWTKIHVTIRLTKGAHENLLEDRLAELCSDCAKRLFMNAHDAFILTGD